MIAPIDSILRGASAVRSIVGTRIYRSQAPDQAQVPYVVWSIVSALPENNLSQAPELDEAVIQVDGYADTQQVSRALCEAMQAALEANYHVIFGPSESREDDTKLWRWLLQLTTFTNR